MIIPEHIVRHVAEGMAKHQARMAINNFGDPGPDGQNPCLVILINPAAMVYWADFFGEAGIVYKKKLEAAVAANDQEKIAEYTDKKEAVLAFFAQVQQAALGGGRWIS